MKKIFLSVFVALFSIQAICQVATSLHQNFDASCVTTSGMPSGWSTFNPITSTIPNGMWSCAPTNGRAGTPGMQCTGTYSSAFHLDTSFLLTPALNLSGYSGSIYLQFDSKTTNIYFGDTLHVEVVYDSTHPDSGAHVDLTSSLAPVFGPGDSTGWVTHVADLTPFKSTPFYIAFLYNSPVTSGNIWYIDNVNTTVSPVTLNVPGINNRQLQLSVSGCSTGNEVGVFYRVTEAGEYQVSLFDVTGRIVYKNMLEIKDIASEIELKGLNLNPGVYILKLGNESVSGFTKVFVR